MKMRHFNKVLILSIALLFGCNSNNTATSQPTAKPSVPTVTKPTSSVIFLKSLGVMANIPSDHIKAASKNIFRMYSPDGLYEYFCTWEKTETPDRMKRAFIAGTDMGNGMFSRVIGEVETLSATSEAFNFGIYLFENSEQILCGYEIHDWSSPNGVLVISLMGTLENVNQVKDKATSLYNSIEILSPEKLEATRAKVKQDRITIGRNEEEQMYYSKINDHTLLHDQMIGSNPPVRSTQRFELCSSNEGRYEYISGTPQKTADELVQGKWDIVEDDDGVLLLVITSPNGQEDKWAIGLHKSGNVTIGGVEFILHKKGTQEGPKLCP